MPTLWSQVSMASAEPVPLTAREAASGLLGSISLTCWIFVLVCVYPLPCSAALRFVGLCEDNTLNCLC